MDESLSQDGTPSTQELGFVLRLCQPEIRGQGSGGIRQESETTAVGLEMLDQSHMGFSARLLSIPNSPSAILLQTSCLHASSQREVLESENHRIVDSWGQAL